MDTQPDTKTYDDPKAKAPGEKDSDRDLLTRIRDRYKVMTDADNENRRLAMLDLKFVNLPGAQWEPNMRQERGSRPCMEFNKLRPNGKRVINEIRANRPNGKVRAVEDGDKPTADIYEGLCRNIANVSDFDTVTDQAAEYQVDAGYSAWRVVTEYSSDEAFDQDIFIRGIRNPFCLYYDPAAQDPLKRDAEDWILTERISNQAFKEKYGEVETQEWDRGEFDDHDQWEDGETTRVCEYWYREPYDRDIILVRKGDGSTITLDAKGDDWKELKAADPQAMIVKKRTAKAYKIKMCVASGSSILEGPTDWAGSQFPFVVVFGEQKIVDGKQYWWGLHRFSKDAQQSYNFARTSISEKIAQAPNSKILATVEQLKGHTALWDEAHRKNFPYLTYNPDPKAPGPPQTIMGAQIEPGLTALAEMAAEDIRDTSGLHEASFGEEGGEKSGIALQRKQNQAAIVTYNYPDNMAKGAKRTWEILIDLIPKIYDTERELRIIGKDGQEDFAKVNTLVPDMSPGAPPGATKIINDLTVGKYDVTVTTGPSFATQRQEAAQVYAELFPAASPVYPLVADLIAKSLDYPYSDEIAERLKMALPPNVLQQMSQGKALPPEIQQAQAQMAQQQQLMQQHGQLIQAAQQELEQNQQKAQADLTKREAAVHSATSDLKVQHANFDAAVAKAKADLATHEARLSVSQNLNDVKFDRDSLTNEVRNATSQLVQHFTDVASRATMPTVVVPPHPKVLKLIAKRVPGGALEAHPVYEGDAQPPVDIGAAAPQPNLAGSQG